MYAYILYQKHVNIDQYFMIICIYLVWGCLNYKHSSVGFTILNFWLLIDNNAWGGCGALLE